MNLCIENLTFRAIIGILPKERKIAQKVVVSLELEYEYKDGDFVNYADIVQLIKTLMRVEKFELLEDAVMALEKAILSRYEKITKLHVAISKPEIIKNTNVKIGKRREF